MQERDEQPNAPPHIDPTADPAAALLAMQHSIAARLDTVAQTLFTARLIADVLQRIWERSPREGQARLAELRLLAHGALLDVRGLLADLRSNELPKAGRDDASFKKEP
jgi:signal transduction histidine kinase